MKAHPFFYNGLAMMILGCFFAMLSWIKPYLHFKKEPSEPSSSSRSTPLPIIGLFSAFLTLGLGSIPFLLELILALIPWSFGWKHAVSPVLAKYVFWIFNHSLISFSIMIVATIYCALLPKLAASRLFSDTLPRYSFLGLMVLSVWSGLSPLFEDQHLSLSTQIVTSVFQSLGQIPIFLLIFSTIASLDYAHYKKAGASFKGLWLSQLPLKEPDRWLLNYFIVGLGLWILSGFTGLIQNSPKLFVTIQNTSWSSAHSHLFLGGPITLVALGMSLHIISWLLEKPVAAPKLVAAVPYMWGLGNVIFSTALAIEGLLGEPYRTALAMSYLNSKSPLHQGSWHIMAYLGMTGGLALTLAGVLFFYATIRTLFQVKIPQPVVVATTTTTTTESFDLPWVQEFPAQTTRGTESLRRWILTAALGGLLIYMPTFFKILNQGTREESSQKAYSPQSPLPLR